MQYDTAPTRELLDRLFVAMRTMGSHGAGHPLTEQAVGALCAAVDAAGPPFSLQFVADGVFRDRILVALDVEQFVRAHALSRALDHLSAHEITFESRVAPDAAAQLARALARGQAGPCDDLDAQSIPGVSHREIANARLGVESEAVDPEIAAVTQVTLAAAAAEPLAIDVEGPWPWSEGLGVIRRLERARGVHPAAAARTLEMAPDGWSIARRAASAAYLVMGMLEAVGVGRALQRSAAHAALALGMQGFRDRGGVDAAAAADAVIGRLLAAPVKARSGVEPHRLQASTLVHLCTSAGRRGSAHAVLAPLELAYELERLRRPERARIELGQIDLVARATEEMGRRFDASWVRVLVGIAGAIPPGSWVRLPGGGLARVLGPGAPGDPWRPEVLIRGQRAVSPGPVRLVPLHERPQPGATA